MPQFVSLPFLRSWQPHSLSPSPSPPSKRKSKQLLLTFNQHSPRQKRTLSSSSALLTSRNHQNQQQSKLQPQQRQPPTVAHRFTHSHFPLLLLSKKRRRQFSSSSSPPSPLPSPEPSEGTTKPVFSPAPPSTKTDAPGADQAPAERLDLESFRKRFGSSRVFFSDSLERVFCQTATARLTGAEAVYRVLAARGVQRVFGYSGGAVLPLVDQFHADCDSKIPGSQFNKQRSIQFVNTAQEQTAAHAAQAVGRLTGVPGVLVVTSGPGVTNCITALQGAMMDGDPMIVLSGQVRVRRGFSK